MLSDALEMLQSIKQVYKKVIISCSAGVDSIVLLDLLNTVFEPNNVCVIHFTHDMRTAEETEQEWSSLSKTCSAYGNKVFRYKITKKRSAGENYYRQARLSLLKQCAKGLKIPVVLTAHHLNDNVETFLMRLFRGTHLNGLCSMSVVSQQDGVLFYKPLLKITKAQIYNYAHIYELPYFEDPTNQDLVYTRNLIRHTLEQLQSQFPALLPNVDSVITIINKAQQLIKAEASKITNNTVEALYHIDELVLSEWVRQQIARAGMQGLGNIRKEHYAFIINAIKNKTHTKLQLPGGKTIIIDSCVYIINTAASEVNNSPDGSEVNNSPDGSEVNNSPDGSEHGAINANATVSID